VQARLQTGSFRRAVCGAAALFFSTACLHAQASATPPEAKLSYREITDEIGRTIRVPQTVHRVVSLAPSLTETVYALGLQDRLVGDTDYCDFPADAKLKPKVGGALNPSLETIASLHPDLVLVTRSLNRLETVEALQDLGIPSYATDPQTVETILSSIRRLADVLGAPETGQSLAKDLEQHLAEIQQRVATSPPRRVLFVVWMEPLQSVGKNTFIADALRYAGAVSIVDSSQNWPIVSLEEVARLQPDFLVFTESHSQGAARNFDALSTLPGWRILDAVRHKQYAVISDAVNRPAPRIVDAIGELAQQLHPEAFEVKPEPSKESNDRLAKLKFVIGMGRFVSESLEQARVADVEESACAH
jgi:iron complex transport system substrate-binding protein